MPNWLPTDESHTKNDVTPATSTLLDANHISASSRSLPKTLDCSDQNLTLFPLQGLIQGTVLFLLLILLLVQFVTAETSIMTSTDVHLTPTQQRFLERVKPTAESGKSGSTFQAQENNLCLVFDLGAVEELCRLMPGDRVRRLRSVYVFDESAQDKSACSIPNLVLYDLLQLKINESAAGNFPKSSDLAQLSRSIGKSCLQSAPRSSVCHHCFGDILRVVDIVRQSYDSFRKLLFRFDCRREYESEVENPFSANSTCADCWARYREWLLVTQLQEELELWTLGPCLAFCHLAELHCPDFRTINTHDYAGLPSFRCVDPTLAQDSLDELLFSELTFPDEESGDLGLGLNESSTTVPETSLSSASPFSSPLFSSITSTATPELPTELSGTVPSASLRGPPVSSLHCFHPCVFDNGINYNSYYCNKYRSRSRSRGVVETEAVAETAPPVPTSPPTPTSPALTTSTHAGITLKNAAISSETLPLWLFLVILWLGRSSLMSSTASLYNCVGHG